MPWFVAVDSAVEDASVTKASDVPCATQGLVWLAEAIPTDDMLEGLLRGNCLDP